MFAKIRAVSSYLPPTIERNADIVEARFMKKIGVELAKYLFEETGIVWED